MMYLLHFTYRPTPGINLKDDDLVRAVLVGFLADHVDFIVPKVSPHKATQGEKKNMRPVTFRLPLRGISCLPVCGSNGWRIRLGQISDFRSGNINAVRWSLEGFHAHQIRTHDDLFFLDAGDLPHHLDVSLLDFRQPAHDLHRDVAWSIADFNLTVDRAFPDGSIPHANTLLLSGLRSRRHEHDNDTHHNRDNSLNRFGVHGSRSQRKKFCPMDSRSRDSQGESGLKIIRLCRLWVCFLLHQYSRFPVHLYEGLESAH